MTHYICLKELQHQVSSIDEWDIYTSKGCKHHSRNGRWDGMHMTMSTPISMEIVNLENNTQQYPIAKHLKGLIK
jgi:hypothetical protein